MTAYSHNLKFRTKIAMLRYRGIFSGGMVPGDFSSPRISSRGVVNIDMQHRHRYVFVNAKGRLCLFAPVSGGLLE